MLDKNKFYNVLFDPEDMTCFAQDAKGTGVFLQHPSAIEWREAQFFSINPLSSTDKNPTQPYHHSERPRRADCNVNKFRNILIELDGLPLALQQAYIDKLQMPYSTKVFSGKKSYHYIIALESPLKSIDEYRELTKRVHQVVAEADHSTKNPSRLSRVPNNVRQDSGKLQELLEVGARVSNWFLFDWLESHGSFKEEECITQDNAANSGALMGEIGLSGFTKNFLMFGTKEGSRNSDLFKASCDFKRQGIPLGQAITRFSLVQGLIGSDFTEQEMTRTIQSGYSTK